MRLDNVYWWVWKMFVVCNRLILILCLSIMFIYYLSMTNGNLIKLYYTI